MVELVRAERAGARVKLGGYLTKRVRVHFSKSKSQKDFPNLTHCVRLALEPLASLQAVSVEL
jgi:hypothetical protein